MTARKLIIFKALLIYMAAASPVEAKLEKELKDVTDDTVDMGLVRKMVKEAKASPTPVMPAQVLGIVLDGLDVPKKKMESFVKLFLEYWMTS